MNHPRSDVSLFQLIDRKYFDALVLRHGMDRGVRTFTTWEMTCALITCMTLRLSSFRDIESTLQIPRSTLSDALAHRFHGFFQDLCDHVLNLIRAQTRDRKIKKGIRELLAIDSTECRVHGSLFATAGWKASHQSDHRASTKLHTVFHVDGEWIDDYRVTGARRGDSPISLKLRIQSNKTYVFDRAYNDVDFWEKIVRAQSHFVTRLKDCATRRRQLEDLFYDTGKIDGILFEGPYVASYLTELRHRSFLNAYPLRHIIYRDPLTRKLFHFITSDWEASARNIADTYKRRWAVELLFRWLKGHLDIRYLPLKSLNAIKTQISVAVLVQLLLQLKKQVTQFKGTLWDLLRNIRTSFFRLSLRASQPPDACRWRHASSQHFETFRL